jgi:pimeloyl-ACP methyl ester carboxylesterase
MTVVMVHGNPETAAVWGPLLAELRRDDVVTLSPPGFGAPIPDGFGCTVGEYREWLVGELERMDGPVDLVGHDWGGGHVVNVAMARPDLLRSWTTDVVGVFDPGYEWHDLAQVWQVPGEGERAVEAFIGGTVQERAGRLVSRGVADPAVAAELAAAARRRGAERTGARLEVLEGRGHWWMLEDPAGGARVLERFLSAP